MGYQGVILRTTDGGATWVPEQSGTSETLRAVQYRGPVAIIVGADSEGSILYTRDAQSSIDREAVRGESTRSLSIRQNRYGASIELQFSLQSSGYGSIVLVDLLGRIVRTIREAEMEKGAQTLDVDISGLAAGPYFVRLTQQGVVQVGRFSR